MRLAAASLQPGVGAVGLMGGRQGCTRRPHVGARRARNIALELLICFEPASRDAHGANGPQQSCLPPFLAFHDASSRGRAPTSKQQLAPEAAAASALRWSWSLIDPRPAPAPLRGKNAGAGLSSSFNFQSHTATSKVTLHDSCVKMSVRQKIAGVVRTVCILERPRILPP